jgi:hypothetical protein
MDEGLYGVGYSRLSAFFTPQGEGFEFQEIAMRNTAAIRKTRLFHVLLSQPRLHRAQGDAVEIRLALPA